MFLKSIKTNALKVKIQRLFYTRFYSNEPSTLEKKGLVLGVYDNLDFTKAAEKIDNESGGKLKDILNRVIVLLMMNSKSAIICHLYSDCIDLDEDDNEKTQSFNIEEKITLKDMKYNELDLDSERLKQATKKIRPKLGETEVFHGLADYHAVAVVGLGPKDPPYNEVEYLNETKENVRIAAGAGARKLQKLCVNKIEIESFACAEAAAEGAILAVWRFQDLKNKESRDTVSEIYPFDDNDVSGWQKGREKAKAQNFARMLEQCPSNIMTPTHFVECAVEELCQAGIQVEARDYDWMQNSKMLSFLTMAQGSCEPPLLLEMAYCGGSPDNKPVLMIGKGVTFNSGGLCLNPDNKQLLEYSADMAGAAVVLGVFKGLSALKVPINCNAIIPLCENMPGGNAAMPGLVVTALNGKTIRIDNTKHDGRIFLVDGLIYGERYKPSITITVATLADNMRIAMASGPSACYTVSDLLWEDLKKAGADTGDRVWRLPLWRHFETKIKAATDADYRTVGKGKGGEPCTAAAFFKLFAPKGEFIHIDISGTGRVSTEIGYPYLKKNLMTGRPVRTLIEFLSYLAAEGK
ncbi:cytosol aminopeptidase-like [Lycorma delicatula]|uniref:cytosol aminopeptidase-like n=1 Tax=Lycorma delicatula TaxID=130591 RepID=UPI003F510569